MGTCRRRQRRFSFEDELEGSVDFGYPTPTGHRCRMRLADVSAGGLGFFMEHELPGIEFGSQIRAVTVVLGERRVLADLLVVHLTPVFAAGSVCGCLLFPASDEDLITYKSALADMETAADARAAAANAMSG